MAFDFQLQALDTAKIDVLQRSFERFVISYDLWEQTYSVSRMRGKRNQGSHLTQNQVETWCIDNMALPTLRLPKDEPALRPSGDPRSRRKTRPTRCSTIPA